MGWKGLEGDKGRYVSQGFGDACRMVLGGVGAVAARSVSTWN